MSRKGIYHDSKEKKHRYIDKSITNRGIINGKIANDIKRKNPNWIYNTDDLNRGEKWYESGLSLEGASIDDRNNVSFVAGFNKGKRIHLINNQLFELGQEYFDKGCSIDDVPDIYKNNEHFINGFNDRMNNKSR